MNDYKNCATVLKIMYDLDMINSLYYGFDVLQMLCKMNESDLNRTIELLLQKKLVANKLQYSYMAGAELPALKITQFGVDVVLGNEQSPLQIDS